MFDSLSNAWKDGNLFSRRRPSKQTPVDLRPERAQTCQVVGVANEKGGAGKTHWTILSSRMFYHDPRIEDIYGRKPRIALVGIDSSIGLERLFGFEGEKMELARTSGKTLESALHHPDLDGKRPLSSKQIVHEVTRDIHLYPCSPSIQDYDEWMITLKNMARANRQAVRAGKDERGPLTEERQQELLAEAGECERKQRLFQQLVKGFIDSLRSDYDRVYVDFKPNESQLNIAGMMACDMLQIPLTLDENGVAQARHQLLMRDLYNPECQITAVIPMNADKKSGTHETLYSMIRRKPREDDVPDLSPYVVNPIWHDPDIPGIVKAAVAKGNQFRAIYKRCGAPFDQILKREGLI